MSLPKSSTIALRLIISIVILTSSLAFILLFPSSGGNLLASESYTPDSTANVDLSVQSVQIGLTGDIATDIVVTEWNDKKTVLLGTSKGLYIISEGDLQEHISTPGSVTDITLLNDITNDSQQEIVIALDDTTFPNIRCYDGTNGDKLWQFAPRQDAFLENILWTEVETATFDIEAVGDMNSDGYQDIAATSGYGLYLLNGKTGEQIWKFEAEDNLWEIAVIPDINGDGIEELAAGSQIGLIYILNGKNGDLIWKKAVSEQIVVFGDGGGKWASIDTSVWDIVPIEIRGKQMIAISSEDGKVRLVNTDDGTYEWETLPLIQYSSSLLFSYYRNKNKLPTSPGDGNFFNLRLSVVEDINGDGFNDILASIYSRRGSKNGTPSLDSGLFMIDSDSGEILWENTNLELENVDRIESATIDAATVILLPQEKSNSMAQIQTVALEDGELVDTLEITSPQSNNSSVYWIKAIDEDCFVTVSNSDDLLCVSSDEEVQWHYPRINDVAVENGEFTGNSTADLFIWSKQRLSDNEQYGARILYVIDGDTRSKSWSYEIPYEDLAAIECITGIKVTSDLNGDGKQDIIGYTKPRSGVESSKGNMIMIFSGNDGSILLNQRVVTQEYYGIYDQLYEARDSSNREFETLVSEMLNKGVQKTYYAIYEGLNEKPLLKAEIDYFIDQILAEGGYDERWADDSDWMDNLKRFLDESRQGRKINGYILSLDTININGEIALIVGCQRDSFIISLEGELLWTKNAELWVYQDPFRGIQPDNIFLTGWETLYFSLGDINDDSIDDLLVYSHGFISAMTSTEDKLVPWEQSQQIYNGEGKTDEGMDPQWVQLTDDVDGDGISDVAFILWQKQKGNSLIVASTISGETLFEMEWQGGQENMKLDLSCADFNNDSYTDHLLYWRWHQDINRPGVEVISGKDNKVLFQFIFQEDPWLYDGLAFQNLVMPATPISDQSGDGIVDIAILKALGDQPGTSILIYKILPDNTEGELLKEIAVEEIDEAIRWDRRWIPGILIEEMKDFNGDGTKEIALTALPGKKGEKQLKVIVVDVANERPIVEFQGRVLQFVKTENENELAMLGANGELYFLNMNSNLQFTDPSLDGSAQSSPLKIAWEGVPEGSYNVVYIDDVEVARTNENEVILDVARGEHQIVVCSLDEYGRGLYAITTIRVEKSTSIVIFVSIALVISILLVTYPFLSRPLISRLKELRRGR